MLVENGLMTTKMVQCLLAKLPAVRCSVYMWSVLLLTPFLFSGSVRAEGGYWLEASRLIVMQGKKGGATITARNDTDTLYLEQSRVLFPDGVTGYPLTASGKDTARMASPFLVTPPLQRLEPRDRLTLRVLPVNTDGLPVDRESLFYVSANAIPAQSSMVGKSQGEGNSPRFIVAQNQIIKLFWRPKGLSETAIFDGEVDKLLSLRVSGDQLQVTNPTPYFVTFRTLRIDGKAFAPELMLRMVPPKGTQQYSLPTGKHGGKLDWNIIDEYGLNTKMQTSLL